MSVEDFLKSNPGLSRSDDDFGAATEISLSVVVRAISSKFIDFVHMGLHYKADLKDVLSLEEIKNSSLGPKAATISLNRDAVLLIQRAVSAIDLANTIPFGFEKLSAVSDGNDSLSAREKAWLRATGYPDEQYAGEARGGSTFSTSTRSAGHTDDERADQFAT